MVKSLKPDCELRVDWATYKAAEYACKHWHYSGSVPVGKLVKVGAWEDGKFIGVVIFSRGANKSIGTPYGLDQTECCELTRVALRAHKHFVSEILARAIRFLKEKCPEMRLIVSYSDLDQNHHGGIYQATNWIYEGKKDGDRYFIVNGKLTHPKSIHAKYGTGSQRLSWLRANVDKNADVYMNNGKHKYLFPLDKKMRKQILPLHREYPRREVK